MVVVWLLHSLGMILVWLEHGQGEEVQEEEDGEEGWWRKAV